MTRYRLSKINQAELDALYDLLEIDFCYAERREREAEGDMLRRADFSAYFIECEGKRIGYITTFEMQSFTFIEHFAILPELRSLGHGSKFFSELLCELHGKVILEAERPTDEITERRIAFYKRLGFSLNPYDYYQPSYHGGGDEVPMRILSYPTPLSDEEYSRITGEIYKTVYGLN